MVSIEKCRRILGESAENMTDAEIEAMRSGLERTADALFTQMTQDRTESVRWYSHFQHTGETE